ncbi:MAG TPA: type II secretion system F family protein [Polyangiaceae bacterium]
MRAIDPHFLKWGAAILLVGGLFALTVVVVGAPQGLPRRYWGRYVVYLESKLQRMYNWTSGTRIAVLQVAGIIGCFALYVIADLPGWYLFAVAVAVAPAWYIERMRQKRVVEIEGQIDGFLIALSNALKATPSLGDAFKSVGSLIRDPLREEIATSVKEMRFGATLDQAILLMASRVGSHQLDSALSAVLIGRQVGGNLPKILETTANSLREMARLEGVVRTKTAEGKMQMWVLAVFPLLLILAVNSINPGYFDPMTSSFVGYLLVGFAVVFWLGALVSARKILAVDI